MHRKDAEDAIQSLDETDPFSVGRRIMVRWGKSVKKTAPSQPRADDIMVAPTKSVVSEEVFRERQQIRVAVPMDVLQRRVIDTIASYVAVDGEQLESQLRQREDLYLYFLRDRESPDYIYFKWRVYSFAHGSRCCVVTYQLVVSGEENTGVLHLCGTHHNQDTSLDWRATGTDVGRVRRAPTLPIHRQ